MIFLYYCPLIIMSLSLKQLGIKISKKNIIKDAAIINVIGIIGYFFAGFLSEVKFIGRKICIALGFLILIILISLSFVYSDYFNIFLGVESIFLIQVNNIIPAYAYEYYNTKLRDTATGYLWFCARISGFASQFIGVELDEISVFSPYYLMILLSFIGGILALSLPYETCGLYLDINKEHQIKQQEIEKENISIHDTSDCN